MADLVYVPHETPSRPFKKGDRVELIDSEGAALSVLTVRRAARKVVHVSDGRRFTPDGRWIGASGKAWPFPTIRLAQPQPAESK
jgi:hypothetical protein